VGADKQKKTKPLGLLVFLHYRLSGRKDIRLIKSSGCSCKSLLCESASSPSVPEKRAVKWHVVAAAAVVVFDGNILQLKFHTE